MDDTQSLQQVILKLAERYIERQKITLEAFRALRPAILEADHVNMSEDQLIRILLQYIDSPWQGHWQEWSYYFHGAGCRLINSKTSEIIEWEASNVNTFDRYWFVNWLEWLWMFHPNDEGLASLKGYFSATPNRYNLYNLVFPILRVLVIEGYIHPKGGNKNMYTIIPDENKSQIAC